MPPTMGDLNSAVSLALLTLGPDAFDLDDTGNPTGFSDAAVEVGRAYLTPSAHDAGGTDEH